MDSTTQTTDPNRCPGCGVVLDAPGGQGMCAACLMSGVLRAGARTAPVDNDAETQPLGPTAPRHDRGRASFELPYELGGYTLVAILGRGGMGTVYEAVQRSSGRRLALKLLAQSLDSPEMRQRFLREGRLAARVNHPSSLYVFGSEEIGGMPVITMEIAAGGTLQDAVDRRGPLPVTQAVDAALSVIDGLEAALNRGVLHRDIKPSNCFVSPDGTVKVGDFGLSVSTLPSADSFMTQTGGVMGTPAFASPEQLRGDNVDARSDIYSVGATLFALLTARAPFEGANAVQVVANVIDTPPADVAELRDGVPPGLSQVIARCLAKEPAGRFADYASLRNALLPFSSVVPEPATQSQRTAAGWIDYLTAFMPTYGTLMIAVGPERLFIRPLYEFSFAAWRYYLLVFAAGFGYFAVTEGIWGAGLGKWILSLRVVTKDGRAPGMGRALARIAIPIATIECVRIPLSVALLPDGEWTALNLMLFIGLATFCPWIAALLWMPARRSNGFATAWDLLTGTRVVVRPRGSRRPAEAAAADPEETADSGLCIGPFRVTSNVTPGEWLQANDPELRRQVWLIRHNGRPVSEARRAAARPGRARWLQEIETEGEVWDAYEADRGASFCERVAQGLVPWSTMRYWLHDLAVELRSAERDDTLAASYSLGQVWITDDGRAMLLDSPWPCAGDPGESVAVDSLDGQQQFLQRVADHVDPLSVPLHARPALQNLRSRSFEKLTFLAGTLKGLLNKPADISRGLRGASLFVIPGYASVATFLGIAANTDPSAGPMTWAGRAAIAVLVMMNSIALFDFILAFWRKSTGLTTFGLEVVTECGRASRSRMLARSAIMWLPVVVPTGVLGVIAMANGTWIPFNQAAILGAVAFSVAIVIAVSALRSPARGLHDRLAGVWVGRR
ncbi:MAG: protein kinase [Phycisphaeraceae bacterium]|nr:protein kinase [Phycisphaeraceae bacterium]